MDPIKVTVPVPAEDERVLLALAKRKGISVTELLEQAMMKEIGRMRVDFAFKLLIEGKIGLKRAWVISRLDYTEYSLEYQKRIIIPYLGNFSEWQKKINTELSPECSGEKGLQPAIEKDFDPRGFIFQEF